MSKAIVRGPANRAAAVAWADECCRDPRAVYLDTETTGLDGRAEVVDIAILDYQGRPLLDTLVRPIHLIPADATAIHGIDDAQVQSAPRWPEIYRQVAEILAYASQVVIYNADFDVRIITQVNALAGLPSPRATWTCAMLGYAAYACQRHERYGGWRWHKLISAAEHFGCPPTQRHRAYDDAGLCRAVVQGMAGQPVLIEAGSRP